MEKFFDDLFYSGCNSNCVDVSPDSNMRKLYRILRVNSIIIQIIILLSGNIIINTMQQLREVGGSSTHGNWLMCLGMTR